MPKPKVAARLNPPVPNATSNITDSGKEQLGSGNNPDDPFDPVRPSVQKYLDRLEQALDARGITWKEAARRLGIWPNKISKWKAGKGHPRFEHIVQLCKVADVPLDWLVHDDPEAPLIRSAEEIALLKLVTRDSNAIGLSNALLAIIDYRVAHPEVKGAAHKKTAEPPRVVKSRKDAP